MTKRRFITNAALTAADIQTAFSDRGGLVKAKQVFGNTLNETLTDLSETLMG